MTDSITLTVSHGAAIGARWELRRAYEAKIRQNALCRQLGHPTVHHDDLLRQDAEAINALSSAIRAYQRGDIVPPSVDPPLAEQGPIGGGVGSVTGTPAAIAPAVHDDETSSNSSPNECVDGGADSPGMARRSLLATAVMLAMEGNPFAPYAWSALDRMVAS